MLQKKWLLSFFTLFLAWPCFSSTALATDQTAPISFRERHLTLAPPSGWKKQPMDSGLLKNCMIYAPENTTVTFGVSVCPAFKEDATFSELVDEFKQVKGARFMTFKKSTVFKNDDIIIIFAPLKEADDGAAFILLSKNLANKEVILNARPLLELFTDFDMPKELFQPDNF